MIELQRIKCPILNHDFTPPSPRTPTVEGAFQVISEGREVEEEDTLRERERRRRKDLEEEESERERESSSKG